MDNRTGRILQTAVYTPLVMAIALVLLSDKYEHGFYGHWQQEALTCLFVAYMVAGSAFFMWNVFITRSLKAKIEQTVVCDLLVIGLVFVSVSDKWAHGFYGHWQQEVLNALFVTAMAFNSAFFTWNNFIARTQKTRVIQTVISDALVLVLSVVYLIEKRQHGFSGQWHQETISGLFVVAMIVGAVFFTWNNHICRLWLKQLHSNDNA